MCDDAWEALSLPRPPLPLDKSRDDVTDVGIADYKYEDRSIKFKSVDEY